MLKKSLVFTVITISLILVLVGCSSSTSNNPPQITDKTPASPYEVQTGGNVSLSVTATDADNDSLAYQWTATDGSLSSTTGKTVDWTAPANTGQVVIAVVVTDGKSTTKASWEITVKNSSNGNNAPTIQSATPASPLNILVNETQSFSVNAVDPENDSLTYTWTATDGNLSSTTGATVDWTAPAQSGSVTLEVTVSDGNLEASHSWDVTVKNIVHITSDINSTTVWDGDKIYLIDKTDLNVSAALQIKPGAIIKFKDDSSMEVTSSGYLNAVGSSGSVEENTPAKPIIFTSQKDDSFGGDTNGDQDITSPSAGDWYYIRINGGAEIVNCEFYYGGGHSSNDYTLKGYNSNVTLKNSTFAHNTGADDGVVDMTDAESATVITGNVFYDNEKPLAVNSRYNLDDSNTFHDPDNSAVVNDLNTIFVDEAKDVESSITWKETEVPYVIGDYSTYNRFDISGIGGQLNIDPGVVLKFLSNTKMRVYGSVVANSATFTSYRDDAHGGDSNGDNSITSPAAGDWEYIVVAGSGEFNQCKFYYGGGYDKDYTLTADNGNITVGNSEFAHNKGLDNGTLDLGDANSASSVTMSTFYDNERPLVINARYSMDDTNVFHNPSNTAETNDYNGIYVNDGPDVESSIQWEETEVPFVLGGFDTYQRFDIKDTGTLTLADNVALKFMDGAKLRLLGGTLVQSQSTNIFTSYKDDSVLGDTNNDGSSTSPAVNDWKGIYDNGSDSWQTWTNIYYDEYAQNIH